MVILLQYMMLIFGFILAGLCGLMPLQNQLMIPDAFRVILFIMGFMIGFIGVVLVHMRAIKTGAVHLINPGRPNQIIWFYAYRDGTIKITPSMRVVEGQLYSKELDAQIHDMKSYKIFDHSVRFVPEALGHAIDLDMCLYATILKNKWGLNNIREARRRILGVTQTGNVMSQEIMVPGKMLDDEYSDIAKYELEMKRKNIQGGSIGPS